MLIQLQLHCVCMYYKWSNIIEKFTNAKRAHDNCSLKKSYMSIYGRSPLEIQMNFYSVRKFSTNGPTFKKTLLFSKLGLFGLSHLVQRRHDVLNSFMTLAVLHHKDLNVPHSIRRIYIGTFFSRKNPINCCWFGLFKVLKNANNVMNMTLS